MEIHVKLNPQNERTNMALIQMDHNVNILILNACNFTCIYQRLPKVSALMIIDFLILSTFVYTKLKDNAFIQT